MPPARGGGTLLVSGQAVPATTVGGAGIRSRAGIARYTIITIEPGRMSADLARVPALTEAVPVPTRC